MAWRNKAVAPRFVMRFDVVGASVDRGELGVLSAIECGGAVAAPGVGFTPAA